MDYATTATMLTDADALIRGAAAEQERAGRVLPEVLEALYEAAAFKVLLPGALGGGELTLPDAMRIYEQVSRSDGATGWTVMIGAGAGLFGGYLDEAVAREILGGREDVIAGSGAPGGTATAVPGGFRVSGRWKYASGAPHATWFTANCRFEDEVSGEAVVQAVAVPRADVEVIETWQVTGMRATGSHDIAMADVFVPAGRVFTTFGGAPVAEGPLYRYPFGDLAALTFAPIALGIADRAIEEFARLSARKRPYGGTRYLDEIPGVGARLAEARVMVESARGYLYAVADRQWRDVVAGETEPWSAATGAARNGVANAARAVDLLYEVSGMDVLFQESALGRCWRDVHTVTQSATVSALQPLLTDEAPLRTE